MAICNLRIRSLFAIRLWDRRSRICLLVTAFGFYGCLGGPWATQGPRLGRNGL